LSFQRSFDASFRLSFEASDERSNALSFEMSDALSDEASFGMSDERSYEVSFRVCFLRYFPANSETSFLASFQDSFQRNLRLPIEGETPAIASLRQGDTTSSVDLRNRRNLPTVLSDSALLPSDFDCMKKSSPLQGEGREEGSFYCL
jgi:hypothetical protein